MNILHIGKFYPPFHGGMENYLSDLANEQVQQGHQVTVWVHNHEWGRITSDTSETLDGKINVIRQKSLKPLLFTPLMLGFRRQLQQLLKKHQPDIIHLHWPNPSLFHLLFNAPAKQIPWVISWHSDMVTENSSWLMKLIYKVIRPLESKLIKQADSLLVSTQSYADHSKQLIKHANKTSVIPLGIRTAQLDELLISQSAEDLDWVKAQWQSKPFRLFNLGRLTFYKNQQMLIDAMPMLSDCQLVIAGDGQLKAQLKAQIAQAGLQSRVNLLGSKSWQQVHALFATCQVFCMASHDRAESFGVVLLEAMYHNKIILVPDTVGSGMSWLAENYNKGFIFKADDQADFIEKVNQIRSDFVNISQRPKQFNYEMSEIAVLISAHYQTIINRRKK